MQRIDTVPDFKNGGLFKRQLSDNFDLIESPAPMDLFVVFSSPEDNPHRVDAIHAGVLMSVENGVPTWVFHKQGKADGSPYQFERWTRVKIPKDNLTEVVFFRAKKSWKERPPIKNLGSFLSDGNKKSPQ